MPWANRVDADWWRGVLDAAPHLVVVENHVPAGGLGSHQLSHTALSGWSGRSTHVAVREVPKSGSNDEVLRRHGLDTASLVAAVQQALEAR
jgi:transketolase